MGRQRNAEEKIRETRKQHSGDGYRSFDCFRVDLHRQNADIYRKPAPNAQVYRGVAYITEQSFFQLLKLA